MRDIQPVHLGDSGPNVSNLHKGLLFLVLYQPGISDNDRSMLQRRLAPELRTQTFGAATADIVGIWQYQFKYWPNYLPALSDKVKAKVQTLMVSAATGRGNGDVDDATAYALNWLLTKLGAL